MKFEEQSVELIPQPTTLEEAYKLAELAGRVSYMSHDSTTEDSYKRFIENMKKNEHLSVLEFTPIYVTVSAFMLEEALFQTFFEEVDPSYYRLNIKDTYAYITTNLRVIIENYLEMMLEYWVPPTEHHVKRVMFKFVTNIGVSRECNRHRKNSILEMSSRYCNYSKDKFGNELTFIYPESGYDKKVLELYLIGDYTHGPGFSTEILLVEALKVSESTYMSLIEEGVKPQEARHVLPLLTKTVLYHSAFEDDWQHFIKLRSAKNAHPDIQFIANEVKKYI